MAKHRRMLAVVGISRGKGGDESKDMGGCRLRRKLGVGTYSGGEISTRARGQRECLVLTSISTRDGMLVASTVRGGSWWVVGGSW